jgi:hypothetical protein
LIIKVRDSAQSGAIWLRSASATVRDIVPGGSADAYAYTFGDPVNASDPSGEDGMPAWLLEADENEAHQLTEEATARRIKSEEEERKAAEEAAARAAAEAAAQAAAAAAALAGPQYAGAEEWGEWEEWEEEGEYEYASDHQNGGSSGKEEVHIESAVLYQPLTEEVANDESGADEPEGWSRIMIKGGPGGHGCAKRKTCHKGGSRRGEDQEVCGAIGGTIGGAIGGAIGGWFGGTIGSVGGAKAGEKICHE